MQHARNLGYVIVRKNLRSVLVQDSRGSEKFEFFVAIELQGNADAIQNFATDAAIAGFETAERAVTDLRQVGDLLLAQPTLFSEEDQHAA